MPTVLERFDTHRTQIQTRSGPVSYIDTGGQGRPVLFVHGVATSSYLWRNVIGLLDGERRCVAIDLPLCGQTPAAPDQDFSLPGLADFVAACCDALDLSDIDLVGNDTGGAVTQLFAARQPDRLATLTLTNCETHTNVHPPQLLPGLLLGTAESARQFQRWALSVHARDLLAIEPALARLHVPTLIVWGTEDIFFKRKWAYWLRDTIPGATEVIELDGARLFFPDERATEFTAALRRHWEAHP